MSHIQIFVGKAPALRKLVEDRRLIIDKSIPDDRFVGKTAYLSYLRVIGKRARVHQRIYKR